MNVQTPLTEAIVPDFIKKQNVELQVTINNVLCILRIEYTPQHQLMIWSSFHSFLAFLQHEQKNEDLSQFGGCLYENLQRILETDQIVLKLSYPSSDNSSRVITHQFKTASRPKKRQRVDTL